MSDHHTSSAGLPSRRAQGRGVWIGFALAGVLLITSAALFLLRDDSEPVTVGDVVRSIRETVLAGYHAPDQPGAGLIGHWHFSAESFDAVTSTFGRFRLESDSLIATAEQAKLVIDVEAASFTFHLIDVRLAALPVDPDRDFDSMVTVLDAYELGPIPLRARVVLDPAKPRRMPVVTPAETDGAGAPQRRASVFDEIHPD